MGKELPLDLRWTAEELYITGSMAFDETAAATGVSVSQLKRWAEQHGWREQRQAYRQAFADIKRNTVELRRRLIAKALSSLNPQDVYAFSALETVAARAGKSSGNLPAPEPVGEDGEPAIRTPAEAVSALKSAVERKLQRMLLSPDSLNLSGIKEIRQMLDLIDKMQAQIAPEAAGHEKKALGPETIKSIRELYGLQ
jgi:hypothetical protein